MILMNAFNFENENFKCCSFFKVCKWYFNIPKHEIVNLIWMRKLKTIIYWFLYFDAQLTEARKNSKTHYRSKDIFIWWDELSEIDIYFIHINFHLVLISIVLDTTHKSSYEVLIIHGTADNDTKIEKKWMKICF